MKAVGLSTGLIKLLKSIPESKQKWKVEVIDDTTIRSTYKLGSIVGSSVVLKDEYLGKTTRIDDGQVITDAFIDIGRI